MKGSRLAASGERVIYALSVSLCLLSSRLRRGSDKGQPADTVGREWQTLYLCRRTKVEAVTQGGPTAVPGVLQNTPHCLCGGARTHARCIALGVLVSSGYPDKALLGN